MIFFHTELSYFESIKRMFKKDILLTIDSFDVENVYLTTKIIQYLAVKKMSQ